MIKIAQKNKRKRKISKKAFIIATIICIVIIIILMIDTLNKIKDNEPNNNDKYAELDNDKNAQLSNNEDIYEKNDCERVSENYDNNTIQVNIKFGKPLYDENNKSNKEYYEQAIKDFVKKYERDFILLDEKKGIKIEVKVESTSDFTYKINSKEDYFKETEEENNKIIENQEIDSINNTVTYADFEKFDNNDWSVRAAGVEIISKEDGVLNYENYDILTDNVFINTIILKPSFSKGIIEGIKVGDSFDTIKSKLGEPQFQNSNMIGYKTKDEYIFFYKDQVAIYPNIKFSNSSLESLINDYIEGKYDQRKNFAFEVLHEYLDFKSTIDENNTLNLVSVIRGIQIQITESNNIEINIYNNYDMTEKTKKFIRENIAESKINEDFIYINEINRVK